MFIDGAKGVSTNRVMRTRVHVCLMFGDLLATPNALLFGDEANERACAAGLVGYKEEGVDLVV